MDRAVANEILRQIGRMNLLAITGGRFRIEGDALVLPVAHGYTVEIELVADLYDVRRVFTRAGKRFVHAERTRVYCDEIGDVAYRASCYHHDYDDMPRPVEAAA